MRSIGTKMLVEKNSDITNQSSPSEYGVDSISLKCTVAPPSSTASAAEITPVNAMRRLRLRRIASVPIANAAIKPISSRLRAIVSEYAARNSLLVSSSGKWKHSTPISDSIPRPADMRAIHERAGFGATVSL